MTGVILEDTSLRDGLQSEKRLFSLQEKTALFRLLADAGVKRIQVGSFVNPKVLPQMAGTDELISIVKKEYPDVLLTALVLNEKGLERAEACGLKHLSMSVSASNTHSLKNVRRPAAEDAVNLFEQIGVSTGIDLQALCKVVDKYAELLGRSLPGRMNRVIKSQTGCCQ